MSCVPVLLRIAEVLGVEPEFFSEAAEELLATDLRAALGDEATGVSTSVEEAVEVARDHPEVARALVALYHRYRDSAEQVAALASAPADASVAALPPAEPHDVVRDLFYAHHNHFAPIDSEAEDAAQAGGSTRPARRRTYRGSASPTSTASRWCGLRPNTGRTRAGSTPSTACCFCLRG